jgi:hypothetical protein
MERGLGEWGWMTVLYSMNVTCMYVNEKDKINIKNGSSHQTLKKRKQIIDA